MVPNTNSQFGFNIGGTGMAQSEIFYQKNLKKSMSGSLTSLFRKMIRSNYTLQSISSPNNVSHGLHHGSMHTKRTSKQNLWWWSENSKQNGGTNSMMTNTIPSISLSFSTKMPNYANQLHRTKILLDFYKQNKMPTPY